MNRWFSIARAISLMTTMAQYLSSLLVIQQICLFLDMVALTRTMLVHPQKLISSTKATAMTVVACFVPVVEEQLQHSLQAPPTMAAPTYSAHHRGCNRPVTSLLHPLRTSSHLWWSSLCRPTTDLSCVVTHGGDRPPGMLLKWDESHICGIERGWSLHMISYMCSSLRVPVNLPKRDSRWGRPGGSFGTCAPPWLHAACVTYLFRIIRKVRRCSILTNS